MSDLQTRLDAAWVDERWAAITPSEREAFLRFGTKAAPWESTPDYAERILKSDPKITLDGARIITAVFRAAYDESVTL
jgi:hypothetical protein